jgi:hypothetical protein
MAKRKVDRRRSGSHARGVRLDKGLELDVFEGPPLGPGVVTATPATVLAALERLDPELPWRKVRDQVVPVLPRVRPFPGPDLDFVRVVLPPGILVGFAIDIGPALTFITSSLLRSWRIDRRTLVEVAIGNVRRLADACTREHVLRDRIGDMPVGVLQSGIGIASALLLVPDRLPAIFGPGPELLLAPMRDVLIALPATVDPAFAAWLAVEWEALDPNHLHLGGFLHERGTVVPVPIEEDLARA